jgi:hypothetical protein
MESKKPSLGWVGSVTFLILGVITVIGYSATMGHGPDLAWCVKAGFLVSIVSGIVSAGIRVAIGTEAK